MTAERLSETGWLPPWVRHQHAARYDWAAGFVTGKRVLEVACGTGYGSHALSAAGARAVDAFDVDPAVVAEAERRYRREGLVFRVGDAQALPVEDGAYDVCVSFETIEHVADDNAFVGELRRALRPGGMLILSTPNRTVTNPGRGLGDAPFNPYHRREYARQDLERLLAARFAHHELLGQSAYPERYARSLARFHALHPLLPVRVHQARKLLGMAWDSRARHLPGPILEGYLPEIWVAIARA